MTGEKIKGKIVASGGCDILNTGDEPVFRHIISLSGKKLPSLLYLPTASYDVEDGIALYAERFAGLGCGSFDTLYLTDNSLDETAIKGKIMNADIIYAGGGNLKFLMDTWKNTGADVYMKKAFQKGTVMSGNSSGAMCWFDLGYDNCGENGSFMFVECLGFLPYCNCPHFDSESWKPFEQAVKQRFVDGIAVDNNTALSYCDGNFDIIKTQEDKSVHLFRAERYA